MDNRKIDQLVALRLLGYTEIKNDVGTTTWLVDEPNEQSFFFLGNEREFSPSERIEDAWKVVEKIGIDFTMNTVNEYDIHVRAGELELIGQYHCNINGFHVYDKSAPLAICKAALKTVGVEV